MNEHHVKVVGTTAARQVAGDDSKIVVLARAYR